MRISAFPLSGLLLSLVGTAPATLVLQMSFEEVVDSSQYVIMGKVVAKEPGLIGEGIHRIPVTRYTIAVGRTYLGADDPTTMTVTNPGGVNLGPDQYYPMPEGFIDYPIGGEVLLMLSPSSSRQTYASVGLHQGIYRVEREKSGELRFARVDASARVVNQKGAPTQPLFEKVDFTEAEFLDAVDKAATRTGRKARRTSAVVTP